MNLFSQIANSKITGSAAYIEPGTYLYAIENVRLNPDGHKGTSIAAEFIVLEAVQTDPENPPNPVGSRCSRVWNFTTNPDVAKPNSKAFLLAALGLQESAITPEQMGAAFEKACGPEQPLRGMLVRNITSPWTTKKGNVLKAVDCYKHVEQDKEAVQTRRKAIENGSIFDELGGVTPKSAATGKPTTGTPTGDVPPTAAASTTSVDDLFGKYQ